MSKKRQYSDLKTYRRKSPQRSEAEKGTKMSEAERAWQTWWAQLYPHLPAGEYDRRFSQDRRFRFDFSWPDAKIAVEIEGGEWSRGRHTRATGYQRDCEKYNLAADLGWIVYRYTPTMLQRDPVLHMGQVAAALARRRKAAGKV